MGIVPLALPSGSSQARFNQGGSAQLVNCYLSPIGEEGKVKNAIYSSDGLQGFALLQGVAAGQGCRAGIVVEGALYVVDAEGVGDVGRQQIRVGAREFVGRLAKPLGAEGFDDFDAFLRDLEDEVDAPMVAAETRIRPLTDPMKMNGCALVLVGGPDLEAPLAAICGWVAQALGAGGGARVYPLSPQ